MVCLGDIWFLARRVRRGRSELIGGERAPVHVVRMRAPARNLQICPVNRDKKCNSYGLISRSLLSSLLVSVGNEVSGADASVSSNSSMRVW